MSGEREEAAGEGKRAKAPSLSLRVVAVVAMADCDWRNLPFALSGLLPSPLCIIATRLLVSSSNADLQG
jgi:hypothetical protein